MKTDTSEFNAYILAGGKSSRMGTDKAMLLMKQKEMILHVSDELKKVFDRIFIVSDNPEHRSFGFEVIEDLIKEIGPAGGILSALTHSDRKYNFIIACDTPFVTSEAILHIIQNKGSAQITMPVIEKHGEPLFAVYTSDCKLNWENLMIKGVRKLGDFVLHFNINKIDVDNHPHFSNSVLMNINTKQDYEKALIQVKNDSQDKRIQS